jgi:hypothetical protein
MLNPAELMTGEGFNNKNKHPRKRHLNQKLSPMLLNEPDNILLLGLSF